MTFQLMHIYLVGVLKESLHVHVVLKTHLLCGYARAKNIVTCVLVGGYYKVSSSVIKNNYLMVLRK